MALISKVDTTPATDIEALDSTPQVQAPPTPSTPEQLTEAHDASIAVGKKLERDLESSYFRGQLDQNQPQLPAGVLFDRKTKRGPGTETAATTTGTTANTAPAKGTSDELSSKVEAEAEGYVGKPAVGPGECYDLADAVLKNAGAKSAPDFDKITGKRDQNYRWGAPIDVKDVKPGDVLQFRDQHIKIETTKMVKRDGVVIEKSPRPSVEEHHRGPQHTSIVLSRNSDGTLTVAEQHVIDPKHPDKLSDTVRKNKLYTENSTHTETKVRHEGGHEIVEETTVKITVTGKTWAYRPQDKAQKNQ